MEFFLIAKIILDPLTNDVILGIFLGYFLESKSYDNCFGDAKGRLEMPMKKARGSNCFDILKEGQKF